jgi:hypothetical protein
MLVKLKFFLFKMALIMIIDKIIIPKGVEDA